MFPLHPASSQNFDLANNYSTNGSVRGFEHLGQQTMPAETIQASAAIFEHRDFQELQGKQAVV